MNENIFFLIGCGRSGTTSMCRILDSATNAVCLVEPMPNLNRESRNMMDGRLENPYQVIAESITPRVAKSLDEGLIYGEKSITFGPFVVELSTLINCKFVFVMRDGRDVVRSFVDWHNRMFGTIYRECKEIGDLSDRAKKAQAALPLEHDSSDYQRPRPNTDDIWYDYWEDFTRLEMCAWYWSRYNDLQLNLLEKLEDESWITIDYTKPKSDELFRAIQFLGLKGFTELKIEEMLASKINSLKDRIDEGDSFPKWANWEPVDRVRFENIATRTMQRLGYYPREDYIRYRPPMYGKYLKKNAVDFEFHEIMYSDRKSTHDDFIKFVDLLDRKKERVVSLLDVECGLSVGYACVFSEHHYVGMNLSGQATDWCRQNRPNPKHAYITGDIIQDHPEEKFDVVFSQGTIDNSYDMDAMLRTMVGSSRGWIYLTAYRGWFPELPEHRYVWNEDTTCFYNDISPLIVRETLQSLGCTDIEVSPLDMGLREDNNIRYETRIVARVPCCKVSS